MNCPCDIVVMIYESILNDMLVNVQIKIKLIGYGAGSITHEDCSHEFYERKYHELDEKKVCMALEKGLILY